MKKYGNVVAEYLEHKPSDFEKNGGLWVIRAGQSKAKLHYQVGPKVVEYYSVHAVRSGSIALNYDNETVLLHEGDLFCAYPNHRYSYQMVEEDTVLRLCWLVFEGNHAETLLERIGFSKDRPFLFNRWALGHESIMIQIQDLLRNINGYDEMLMQSKLYQLFDSLSRKSDGQQVKREVTNRLQRCIQFMEKHYMEGITVSDVVEVAGVHRSHVYQECSNVIGLSPMQYLVQLRMNKSVELLKLRELSMTEIALAVGYPDLYSFSRAFSKYYGMSATQYQMRLFMTNQYEGGENSIESN
ncbi:AraC family transcriptional regulator [Paenibacillus sp. BK720]|uniref:AraC family transcriptional regulator n=1 Tax=Paenibacillus sp. BK720 TaxID=2587092 RepID=UPI0014205D10|nr:AraC family transcriptional regulator [Paenibacillus sp. BK720]NIK67291.1 AraC-like DNA-binding protein [Paenibacillus sp. BK720]